MLLIIIFLCSLHDTLRIPTAVNAKLTLCMECNLHLCLCILSFFKNEVFREYVRIIIRVSISLDQDKA